MIDPGVNHHDSVYSALCEMVLNRRLPKIEVSNNPFSTDFIEKQKDKAVSKLDISTQEASYFVFDGKMKNMAYNLVQSPIILIDMSISIIGDCTKLYAIFFIFPSNTK